MLSNVTARMSGVEPLSIRITPEKQCFSLKSKSYRYTVTIVAPDAVAEKTKPNNCDTVFLLDKSGKDTSVNNNRFYFYPTCSIISIF